MNAVTAYSLAKNYIESSLNGAGAIKGAPCTINSITHNTANKTTDIVFKWTGNNGQEYTQKASIPDGIVGPAGAIGPQGEKGEQGVSVRNFTLLSSKGLKDTYRINFSDNSFQDIVITNGAEGKIGIGIKDIQKTGTNGLINIYTITLTDDSIKTFEITNGKDGFSPKIEINRNVYDNGVVLTVTNKDEPPSYIEIKDGLKGDIGEQGPSPSLSVETLGNGNHKISITNFDGTEGDSFIIKDGEPGKSAYETWKDLGNEGNEVDFINSLVGGGFEIENENLDFSKFIEI